MLLRIYNIKNKRNLYNFQLVTSTVVDCEYCIGYFTAQELALAGWATFFFVLHRSTTYVPAYVQRWRGSRYMCVLD